MISTRLTVCCDHAWCMLLLVDLYLDEIYKLEYLQSPELLISHQIKVVILILLIGTV